MAEENEEKKSFRRPREERGQKIGGTKFGKNEKERLGKMSRRSHATVLKLTATNDVCI